MTKTSTRVGGKVAAAVVAIAVALLLMPYLRDFTDALGVGKDSTDSTVSTLVEWLLAVAVAMLIYTTIVAVPGFVRRRRASRR
jgi:hypothetical protein